MRTSVLELHSLKQGQVDSISLIIITTSIMSPELLWLSVLHAIPLPTLRHSLMRHRERILVISKRSAMQQVSQIPET